ncbi:BsuBI/PstI family type II restriction endonuclease [Actinocorallia sp. A-T 12471]|uniref:BsuBI/PstI family type II restriction endonuclease n=1 Tax=Actinocorallia sp. A-T 12471 TaxID=3089813 RepID=UPI0029D396FE|nr:BsuBI/PstI family type II restriction endonuclease [Actinocorallia sp. A-T 12471]MDX6738152.1 BsuBI/PstI family type II restriction endonuclease [Actinocorallia sp. A-T 12471]
MTTPQPEGSAQKSIAEQVFEAQRILRLLNFDDERCNERSALTFLALMGMTPDVAWVDAERPLLRTVEIMDWLRTRYDKDYKPNSRETIRRFTLHQFIDGGLVVLNPDDPKRPVNSPKNCYQIEKEAFDLIQRTGDADFEDQVAAYLARVPGLRAKYAMERDLLRIPVTLPDGTEVRLSPGGQNELIVPIIKDFCERFTPGGKILYIGDADEKWSIFQERALADLGVTIDSHGKMPDVIVHLPDRNWLVLIEAASSHGPVDSKRHGELKNLFQAATAGLVFISCFPSRADLRQYLKDIAWETDVWCADNPTHLIHFNGERFLGPYDHS